MIKLAIIKDICTWNAERYEQEHNYEVLVRLLKEEGEETLEALEKGSDVDIYDGYADVIYVAIGGLWKLKVRHIYALLIQVQQSVTEFPSLRASIIWYEDKPSVHTLALVVCTAFHEGALRLGSTLGMSDILTAVCISNNTKEVVKTESSIKANIYKGEAYVPPTEDIEQVLLFVKEGVYKELDDE